MENSTPINKDNSKDNSKGFKCSICSKLLGDRSLCKKYNNAFMGYEPHESGLLFINKNLFLGTYFEKEKTFLARAKLLCDGLCDYSEEFVEFQN